MKWLRSRWNEALWGFCRWLDNKVQHQRWWNPVHPEFKRWRFWIWHLSVFMEVVTEWNPWCDHYILDDQCGKPEHRFCSRCMRQQPNQPVDA